MKFEKVLEQFCDVSGIEKRQLLHCLQGPAFRGNGRDQLDTGKAAVIAYSNLQLQDTEGKDDAEKGEWRPSPQTRN